MLLRPSLTRSLVLGSRVLGSLVFGSLVLGAGGLSPSAWAGAPLLPGEHRNNAATLPKGELVLHPIFMPSGYGITDWLEAKLVLLGLFSGPAASLEFGLHEGDKIWLSVEPSFVGDWRLDATTSGATVHLTRLLGENRLNVGVGGSYFIYDLEARFQDDTGAVETVAVSGEEFIVPVALSYDWVGPERIVRVHALTDALSFGGPVYASFGADYTGVAGELFRWSLGATAYVGDIPEIPGVTERIPDWPVVPLPSLELWWRL